MYCYPKRISSIYNHLPKESSAEVGWIVVSPKHASKLGIENVLHIRPVVK